MKFHRNIFLLFFTFFLVNQIQSQSAFSNYDRAIYICDIAKYVKWPSTDVRDNFEIAVLDSDNALFIELQKVAQERKKIHDKPIVPVHFTNISQIRPVQVLFVNRKDFEQIADIYNRIKGTYTLLIGENYDFQESMINFITVKGKRKFEANEERIKEEGFKVSNLFLAAAIKSKEDWQALYQESEYLLQKEREKVASQKILIQKQDDQIATQIKEIEAQKIEIASQKKLLDNLSNEIIQKQNELKQKMALLFQQEKEIRKQSDLIKEQIERVRKQKQTLQKNTVKLENQKKKIESQNFVLAEQLKEIEKQRLMLYFMMIFILLLFLLGYFIYRGYKIKKEANRVLKEKNIAITLKNQEILQQKEEIETQRDEIEKHRDMLIEKNEEILQQKEEIMAQRDEIEVQRDYANKQRDEILYQRDQIMNSIKYAKRIQNALLPLFDEYENILGNHFILYKPKDVVSGDFYWITEKDGNAIFAASDCTGHGVPGAFMSMLGMAFLNEIINKENITKPSEILGLLRSYVIRSLKQQGRPSEVKEGMDITICKLNRSQNHLEFAGAFNPMYIIRNNELLEFKGDVQPIGIYERMKDFTNYEIDVEPNDMIYLFSDGFPDQFGGPKRKKFMKKQFKQTLMHINEKPLEIQKSFLDQTIEEWKEGNKMEQTDDILIIGVRV